jgi:hypothetical protein
MPDPLADLARARRFAELRALARGESWTLMIGGDGAVSPSGDGPLLDWLREYGPLRDRPDKSVAPEKWRQNRLKEIRAAFPGRHITRAKLRELGRHLGKGYT